MQGRVAETADAATTAGHTAAATKELLNLPASLDVNDVQALLPEQLEKQMTPQEIRDLFAFLTLDRPPGDPKAKLIPGTPR